MAKHTYAVRFPHLSGLYKWTFDHTPLLGVAIVLPGTMTVGTPVALAACYPDARLLPESFVTGEVAGEDQLDDYYERAASQ